MNLDEFVGIYDNTLGLFPHQKRVRVNYEYSRLCSNCTSPSGTVIFSYVLCGAVFIHFLPSTNQLACKILYKGEAEQEQTILYL